MNLSLFFYIKEDYMDTYGMPPLKIDYTMDFIKAREIMLDMSKTHAEFGNREFLVTKRRKEIIGYTNISELMGHYFSKKVFYLYQIAQPKIYTSDEKSLSMKKILNVTGKHRSLFVTKNDTKRKRFQKYTFDDICAEINAGLAIRMLGNDPIDSPGLLKLPLKT